MVSAIINAILAASAVVGPIVEGECPAVSKDGRRLAFQRWEGDRLHLGVFDLETKETKWIVRGETDETKREMACHPSWGPRGELVFAYANITNTAYQRFHKSIDQENGGYRIRVVKPDGETRDIVKGLTRNYSPCFSPDGKTIYFCRQDSHHQGIAKVAVDSVTGNSEWVRYAPPGDCGLSQPVVSPNGRRLAYAEMSRSGGTWGIKVADITNTAHQASISPGTFSAYAPNWSPGGKYLVFTGYEVGDPGWCVYLQRLDTGTVRRIAEGEDGTFSPDNESVYFSKDGKIYRCDLKKLEPFKKAKTVKTPIQIPDSFKTKEVVLDIWKVPSPGESGNHRFDVPHACNDSTYHFHRFKLDWDGSKDKCFLYAGGFKAGFWVFMIDGSISAHGAQPGAYCVAADGERLSAGTHTITIITCNGCIWISTDGSEAFPRRGNMALGPCEGKASCSIFPNGTIEGKTIPVYDVEVGIGWPNGVPPPLNP